jgi:hypothetical protein
LWFINGKVSVTWNLKQAIVQKPKTSSFVEGTCFLRPKAADVEKLKTQAPPEDDIDPDGAVGSTIVDDSDEEEEYDLPAPAPAPVPVPAPPVVAAPAPTPAPAAAVASESGEPKKKRVVTKKA